MRLPTSLVRPVLLAVMVFSTGRIMAAAAGNSTTTLRPATQGTIRIMLPDDTLAVSRDELFAWVDRAAAAAAQLYGRFPVNELELTIRVDDGRKIHGGVEYDGRRIVINVGRHTPVKELKRDWILTHEMIHLGFPDVAERYHWMEEGLATYFEALVRARTGDLKPEDVWREWVESMAQGLPEPGDRGLDNTPTWGRTYWGGALFWLLADVEIRERSGDRYSLDDAIRHIRAAGGYNGSHWRVTKVLEEGDRATGLSVLKDLHDKWGGQPVDVDLPALWRRLGVVVHNRQVSFDDDAPLAALRASMTVRRTENQPQP